MGALPKGTTGKPLSKREAEVACRLAAGKTNRQIASELDITIKTVDTHRQHVLQKLDLVNNAELAVYWWRTGQPIPPNANVDRALSRYESRDGIIP